MNQKMLEKKLEKLKQLERRIAYYEDRQEIEALMYASETNHNQKHMSGWPDYYALSMPDVSCEIADRGNYVGKEIIENLFHANYQIQRNEGSYLCHWQTTPMIEIAKDRQTAHGVWTSPGAETVVDRDGVPVAVWNFIRYAYDFVRENGKWKLYHYRIIMDIKADYDKGWTKDYFKWTYMGKMPGASEEPPSFNVCYSPAGYLQRVIPTCPEPYETWTDETWFFREEPECNQTKRKKGGTQDD